MELNNLLYKVSIRSVAGGTDREVKGITIDSRNVAPGYVFVAMRGGATDGHRFIENAEAAGATTIVCEVMPEKRKEGISYIEVQNSAEAAGIMAHRFNGSPSEKLKLVGVTGTNGKTTIATLLYKLFTSLGHESGLLSTVQNQVGQTVLPATHTTPDPVSLNELLKKMLDGGCTHVFMEVSSHAIHQHRISGLSFAGAIFSNITHDHLDYHKTFDEYIRVKKSFFDDLPSTAFALSNLDDKRGNVMLQNTTAKKTYYSLRTMADFKGKILENTLDGLVMSVNDQEVHFRMIGEFNAYNLLAVYGSAVLLGANGQEALRQLSMLQGAEGRFDFMISPAEGLIGIVDYAHTPDALLNVLATIRKLRQKNEQVVTVVGCGGDRDRTKRPLMAAVAAEHSEKVVFTSDNPRSEDPAAILKEMEQGLNAANVRKCLFIADRKEAIKTAVSLAKPGDIVLVAGKGHEKYQEIMGVKHPFDDKEILREVFTLLER